MAVFTNGGLNLIASALQSMAGQPAITFVSVGLGAGTLSSGLTSGNPYTSLPLVTPLTVSIANGQSLTIIDALGDMQVVNCTGNNIGDAAIAVTSFIANANYAIGSGIANTPLVTDTMLQNETWRVPGIIGSPGALTGESLNPGYFDPTAPSGTYLEVGYWGGATATGSLGTGTLICRDVQFWSHTINIDSANFQMDSVL